MLARLFVVHEAGRDGAGESLLRAAMDYADKRPLRLVLGVMTKDASAIYEHLGWERIGTTAHTYGDNESAEAVCFVSPTGRTSARP